MDIIELEKWKPSADDPRKLEYAGQRTAEDVFEQLRFRLDSQGYLPDEYFLLRDEWEEDREIPRDADLFCTVDYGASEGVYLDVYLKWYDEAQKKSITKSFITGKTLGENGNDLDRMFLTASAITKAVHGDHATHARYVKIGGVEDDMGGRVVHLSQQEEKTIIDALVEQRERQEMAMTQTEQLLRRMTGSITGYMDLVGQRPLHMNDCDKAVLAIRDGELAAFKELYPRVPDSANELLIEAAGRPGEVGRKMTVLLLADAERFPETVYRTACQKAIDINDPEKVSFLLEQAEDHVVNLSPSFYGEAASYAYLDHRCIAKEIVKQCSSEQIAAAPPYLLEQFAQDADYRTLSALVEKGISGGDSAWRTMHMLTCKKQDQWIAESLLESRMWVDVNDYGALHACMENDAVDVAKLLLDGGMDLERYKEWAKRQSHGLHYDDTLASLEEHWTELQSQKQEQGSEPEGEQEQDTSPQMGGMTFG